MYSITTFAIVAIAATIAMMIGTTIVPNIQTAVADRGGFPDDNANPVAGHATNNKEFFEICKQSGIASDCAQSPFQLGNKVSENVFIHLMGINNSPLSPQGARLF
jgi:hypothetical protein